MKKLAFYIVVIMATLAISNPVYASQSKNPYGTSTIDPAAPNEIIFSIAKKDNKADFAYPRLLKLKQSTISIYEPFLKKRQSFTVIKLQTLFNFAGITGDDRVITKALNDYLFAAKASDFIKADGYLAIKRDGVSIPYDQGGPIRIIFPDKSKWAKNLDAWNWSLRSITVK